MGNKGSKGTKGTKGKQDARVTDQDRAVLELKLQRDRLKQYKKRIHGIMERETEIAKQLLKEGKKGMALLALRKKRSQEKMLHETETKIDTVEGWVNSLESAQRDKQVFDAMRVGKDALDEINKEMSLEAVEALLEETEEATALHKQIEETLMGRLTVVEEEEMERELEAMMGHSAAEELPQVPTTLPDVPTQLPDGVTSLETQAASKVAVAEGVGREDEEEEEEDGAPMPPPPPKKDSGMLAFPDVPKQAPAIYAEQREEDEEEEEDGVPLPPPPKQLAAA